MLGMLARWAALKVMLYVPPMLKLMDCPILPDCWRKATWLPSGADGLAAVNPLPFPATPEEGPKTQGEPVGLRTKPEPAEGCSKPRSARVVKTRFTLTSSRKAVLSPPLEF